MKAEYKVLKAYEIVGNHGDDRAFLDAADKFIQDPANPIAERAEMVKKYDQAMDYTTPAGTDDEVVAQYVKDINEGSNVRVTPKDKAINEAEIKSKVDELVGKVDSGSMTVEEFLTEIQKEELPEVMKNTVETKKDAKAVFDYFKAWDGNLESWDKVLDVPGAEKKQDTSEGEGGLAEYKKKATDILKKRYGIPLSDLGFDTDADLQKEMDREPDPEEMVEFYVQKYDLDRVDESKKLGKRLPTLNEMKKVDKNEAAGWTPDKSISLANGSEAPGSELKAMAAASKNAEDFVKLASSKYKTDDSEDKSHFRVYYRYFKDPKLTEAKQKPGSGTDGSFKVYTLDAEDKEIFEKDGKLQGLLKAGKLAIENGIEIWMSQDDDETYKAIQDTFGANEIEPETNFESRM